MKKIVTLFMALAMLLALIPAAAAEEIVFTRQPQGGRADNRQEFTFTWETNLDCRCMLQEREDETYDWGNKDYVTSPFSLENTNYHAQYRLWVETEDGADYYSDVFEITWGPAANLTTAVAEDIHFGELPLGYPQPQAVPVVITNTGDQTLTGLHAFLAEETALELIENRTPGDLAPGESDRESYSVRPRAGLGIGYYSDSVFLEADNVDELFYNACQFEVVESGAEITYSIGAEDIDFGLVTGDPAPIDLVIRATGTGNLTKVHLKLNGENDFFAVRANRPSVDLLNAGTDTGGNWYVELTPGLPEGIYEGRVEIYAAEIEEPTVITVRAQVGENATAPGGVETAAPTETDPTGTTTASGGFPLWGIIALIAAGAAILAAVLLLIKKRKE